MNITPPRTCFLTQKMSIRISTAKPVCVQVKRVTESQITRGVMGRRQCPEPRRWVRALERKGSKSCVLSTYGKEQLPVRWSHLIVGPRKMNILFHRHQSCPFPQLLEKYQCLLCFRVFTADLFLLPGMFPFPATHTCTYTHTHIHAHMCHPYSSAWLASLDLRCPF